MKDLNHFKKIALLTLALFFLNALFNPLYNQASAASFLSSYQILKQDYSNVIDRIVEGGATEADIEAFLLDLETSVSSKGTLTKDNFNSIMYKSFEEVIQSRVHRTIFRALLTSYGEEIEYTLLNNELHPDLVPIRDAIMQSLLGSDEEPPASGDADNNPPTPGYSENPASPGAGGDASTTPINPAPATDPQPASSNFVDIKGHWAEEYINNAYQKGLVSGMAPSQFAPERQITRAEFAALMLQAIGQQPGTYMSSNFYDVPVTAWYCNVINKAVELGIMAGYSSTQFGPQDPITREQMAVIINRALLLQDTGIKLNNSETEQLLVVFTDQSSISSWARSEVAFALVNGIVTGRAADQFAPTTSATRAEATVMILKMYGLLK